MSIQVKDASGAVQTVNTLPAAGQAASAASLPVVLASDQSAVPVSGTVTTTPPANASTNITEVGGAALALGQKASAASVPVVLASDQSALPVAVGPQYGANTNRLNYSGAITSVNAVAAFAPQGASAYTYVTDVDLFNAGQYSFLVQLLNSSSNAVLWQALVPAGGGLTKSLDTPIGGNGEAAANTGVSLQAQYLGPVAGPVTGFTGAYNNTTGVVTLTLTANAPFSNPEIIVVSGWSASQLNGSFTTASVSGTTVTYQGPTGLGSPTLTSGSLNYYPAPNLYANVNGFKSAS